MKLEIRHLDAQQANRGGNHRPRARRSAFTLVELVVSIGILGLMMAMAGTVFKLTIDSTGEATSLTEVTQALRLLEDNLRRDLANLPQGTDGSMLIIEANPTNAYWRTEQLELDADGEPANGYQHDPDPERETATLDASGRPIPEQPRADVLMFFTGASGADSFQSHPYPAIKANKAQVIYAQAEQGELQSDGTWVGGAPSDFATYFAAGGACPHAAEIRHLARRLVLIADQSEGDLAALYPVELGSGGKVPSMLDDAADADGDSIPPGSSVPLQDGIIDVVDNDVFSYTEEVSDRTDLTFPTPVNSAWYARPRLDVTPPALQAKRLGAYLLPHCASFKVEWALDLRDPAYGIKFNPSAGQNDSAPSELVWFDPGRVNSAGNPDPLGELDDLADRYTTLGAGAVAAKLNSDPTGTPPDLKTSLLVNRFSNATYGINPQTPVWYGNDQPNGGSVSRPDRFFPKALRITVDVYDDSGRFIRPIRHVMVLPVDGP
ncbi:MAG TPA: type II secretion system protein [Phycisphaerae bacterium]|nr:type II secretion system protein [Phycisphaerae bacterium]